MNVTVIIPAINEEATIAKVVDIARSTHIGSSGQGWFRRIVARFTGGFGPDSLVEEVVVVDDHSADETVARAQAAGARVIISAKPGKGASMREGLLIAKSEVVAYLDGDIENYEKDVVARLVQPILEDRADFVKGTFSRAAGRVTELVAKPLLSLLFPEATRFTQPLSGMIAGKREWLLKTEFENDYGVDIGILLDLLQLGARIEEVNIGRIENKMKQWPQLSPMARDVARAILKRVQRRANYSLEGLSTSNIVLDQLEHAFKESLKGLKKMAIFDLDNTIFMGRFIEQVAERHGFRKELADIVSSSHDPFLITKQIAQLLKGLDYGLLLRIADEIPVVPDTGAVVAELKKRGYVVGIVSDGYEFVAQHIALKVGADFAMANELEFRNGVATGEVKMPSYFIRTKESRCSHNNCKSNALDHLSQKYGIPLENMLAVGDSDPDACMVKFAGIGVAFCPTSRTLPLVADRVIETRSFAPILEFAM